MSRSLRKCHIFLLVSVPALTHFEILKNIIRKDDFEA